MLERILPIEQFVVFRDAGIFDPSVGTMWSRSSQLCAAAGN
jgi:hypothetical protein